MLSDEDMIRIGFHRICHPSNRVALSTGNMAEFFRAGSIAWLIENLVHPSRMDTCRIPIAVSSILAALAEMKTTRWQLQQEEALLALDACSPVTRSLSRPQLRSVSWRDPGSHTLFMSLIRLDSSKRAIDVSEQDICEFFEPCGEIEIVCLQINKLGNGQIGHIKFYESESVDKAVHLVKMACGKVKGSSIRVDYVEDSLTSAWKGHTFRPARRGNSAFVLGEQAHIVKAEEPMKAREAEHCQARNAEEARTAVANEKAGMMRRGMTRKDSPPRRIDEDENLFANFKASSSASSSAWLPRRNDILGLDPQLSLAAAAEEAEKKAEKQAELEAAKKENIFRFYDDLRRHSLNDPVAIVNDELEAAKKEKIACFYAALR